MIETGTEHHFNSSTRGRLVRKYSNYFDIYDRYLERFKGRSARILEIGVQHGGSLLMWDAYFDGDATIFGVDILPACKQFEADNIHIYIGDQSDDEFMSRLVADIGSVDAIIDDGSHVSRHQIDTFRRLFYHLLRDGGVYICEDCHTSYWNDYGGGVRRSGSFVEYAKRLCDQLNAWVAKSPQLIVDEATRSIKSISFYSSVIVFEKESISEPRSVASGHATIDLNSPFEQNEFAFLLLPLKQSRFIQSLVRRSPTLWRMMRRLIGSTR
jgi:hypothetical protein